MKKLFILLICVIALVSCSSTKKYETCEYELVSINSYIGNFSETYGSISGKFFLGTGSISGNMYGVSITTSNIFCVIKDKRGTIQIMSIPAKNCDIKIINDSTQRRACAYRYYKCNCEQKTKYHNIRRHNYSTASNIKEILDTAKTIKFDTLDFFSNGKVTVFIDDNNYNDQKNHLVGYDLCNECTYYVFYVLEKDIITLSELK